MAIETTTLQSMQALADWLSANACPDYFASAEYENSVITCKDADGNTVFEYQVTVSQCPINVYKTASQYDTITATCTPSEITPATAAKCGGGLMISIYTSSYGNLFLLITKTNNGVTAIIAGFSADAAAAKSSGVIAAAWGDMADATKTLTFTPSAQNQTQLVPFTTYAKSDAVSYTPHAFYMPVSENYDMQTGKFTDGSVTYITNGHWAVEDVT